MHDVELHRLAAKELRDALTWYRTRSEQAFTRFRAAVFDAIDRISADPYIHAVLAEPYRCARVHRFPYILIFEIGSDGRVFVVAVAHTGRRPGYWKLRKQ
jgi:plasmid stabilization system protein ParE